MVEPCPNLIRDPFPFADPPIRRSADPILPLPRSLVILLLLR
jgi:hypothetical protein